MPSFAPPDRTGIQQCLLYDARNLATVAATNVWMHFHKRMLSHVRCKYALDEAAYAKLPKDERRRRKLELTQVAADLCRLPDVVYQAPATWHEWIDAERNRLGIDMAVGDWKGKPLLYHLKAAPHRFVRIMLMMSKEREEQGGRAFALYPCVVLMYRGTYGSTRRHCAICCIGASKYIQERAAKRRKKNQNSGTGYESEHEDVEPIRRRTKDQMADENAELFGGIVDLRAAGVARRRRFDFAFTTDGVGTRVQMRVAKASGDGNEALRSLPKRGIWAIDQLKHVTRASELHVIGVDPGKRELVSCVDMDDPKGCSPVRYTQRQRQRDLRSRQYTDEAQRAKPQIVADAEAQLAGFHSALRRPHRVLRILR